jgi:hypothetical protein
MTKDEALQQALEALTDFDYDKRMKAIETIKRSLETKEWVGLTEEEVKECFAITPDQFLPWQIYKRVEAKLKERNT